MEVFVMEDELLMPSDAGRLLGISRDSVSRWAAEGRLPATYAKMGSRTVVLVRRRDVELLAAQRRQAASVEASSR